MPSGVRFYRCRYCFGLWAGQKALEEFKKVQEQKVEEAKRENTIFPALSTIFIPALLLLLLFFTTFITIRNLQSARENRIQAQSFLSQTSINPVSESSVALSFETTASLRTQLTYGKSILTQETKWVSVAPTTFHEVLLSDLAPNTAYSYTITLEDEDGYQYTTEVKSFEVEG